MKHLISIEDLRREDAIALLATAEHMAETQERSIRKLPALLGSTVVNLFFEDSTRTRISFEAAAKRLSADVINFSAKGSSVSKGESLKDTALTLQAMGADAVMMLRVQRERMVGGGFFPTAGEYSRRYGLSTARAAALPAHTRVMHPGPMNRGFEIAGDVADGPRSVIVEQVSSGVFVRMAVLYHLLATDSREDAR